MTSTELALANEQSLMKRMDGARWLSQLTPQDKQALAQLAIAYHLDPVMGELVIYEGKPYIPLAGMIRKAHDAKGFEGVEDRPMTKEEREAYAIKQPIGWIAKVYRRGFRVPTVGTGAADPEKPLRNNPVERERPQWMARSRAIRQALRLAFPHSLPFDELESAEEIGIDPETGEIIDGIARELPVEVSPTASIEPFEMPEEPSEDDGEPIPADLAATPTPEPQEDNPIALLAEIQHIVTDVTGHDWAAFRGTYETKKKRKLEDATLAELVAARDMVSEWPAKERA